MAPAIAASICLMGGAVAMGVLAFFAHPPPGVLTHWDYWGGTVGDIAVPCVVYGLTRGALLLPSPGRSPMTLMAAVAGAVLGALSQAAWLTDPDPRRNWLLIAPQTFSAQGWYHAVYLTLTAAYVAGAAWEYLRRAARTPADLLGETALTRFGATVTLTGCGVFTAAIVADSLPTSGTFSSRATIGCVALAPVVLTAFAGLRLRHALNVLIAPSGLALIISVAAGLVMTMGATP